MLDGGGGGLGKRRRVENSNDSIQKELRRLGGERSVSLFIDLYAVVVVIVIIILGKQKYLVREQAMIYASDERRVEHMKSAGDVDAGKAWRPVVRRPSDMVNALDFAFSMHGADGVY
jgi:hypothetical protein